MNIARAIAATAACVVFACASTRPRPNVDEHDDVLERDLDGSRPLSSDAAGALTGPCPDGAVAKGWFRGEHGTEIWSHAAWCEDAKGLLHGPMIVEQVYRGDTSKRTGSYRNGVAHGVFSNPHGRATYVNGLLDGPCTFSSHQLTFHDGYVDGPFRFKYGDDPCDGAAGGGCDPGYSLGECWAANPTPDIGVVSGMFIGEVAADRLVLTTHGRTREIAIQDGVPVDVPELERDPNVARDFADLLGPSHRWAGRPQCPYANDTTAHRGPIRPSR